MADLEYTSRRSVLLCRQGAVSCDQPLAASAGVDVLKAGGNAADAAVAMAAVLNVTLPSCTGLGGDAFCLFYDVKLRQVRGLNGSGRTPAGLTPQRLKADGFEPDAPLPLQHGHCVTVPGAPSAWVDTAHNFGSGSVTLARLLQPAIDLAEQGYPVARISAHHWRLGHDLFLEPRNLGGREMMVGDHTPRWGEVFRNPTLAHTMRELAAGGRAGFYEGRVGRAVAEAVTRFGGTMTLEDLAAHRSQLVAPLAAEYGGVKLWEVPPNGQGIVALMALNTLRGIDLTGMTHNSPEYLHTLIEVLRLAFADGLQCVGDMDKVSVPVAAMLSESHAAKRRALIQPDRTLDMGRVPSLLDLPVGSDTTYLTAVDGQGNACSFINSNFVGFGTGIVPPGTGFTLQNRGLCFCLDEGRPNSAAPGKRPYHTIIPAMLTAAETGELLASYGVMGGFMQPQGHVQVLLNMLQFGMDPQGALDAPRFSLAPGRTFSQQVALEEGISPATVRHLADMGHDVIGPVTGYKRSVFGRGHVITRGAWWSKNPDEIAHDTSALWAATDPRSDGLAVGY